MIRRHSLVVVLSLSTIAVLAGACSDNTPATPQAIFDGSLEKGGPSNDCNDSGSIFQVGDFGNQAVTPKVPATAVKDGDSFGQGTVSIACSVKATSNTEFDVDASLNLSGATGGFFKIDGHFTTTGDQQNIHALFSSRKSGNTYEEKDRKCTVRYTTNTMGVAAGRIWGEIDCPTVENPGAGKTCEAKATFRFENCAQ
jgi:hypothetical protein